MANLQSFAIGSLASPQQERSLFCRYIVLRASHTLISKDACLSSHTRPSRGRFLEGLFVNKLTILVFLKFPRSTIQLSCRTSSRSGSLLILSPLRTMRASFPAHGSSREFQSCRRVRFPCSASPSPRYSRPSDQEAIALVASLRW